MTFQFDKTAAEMTAREISEVRDTIKRTIEHILGFDKHHLSVSLQDHCVYFQWRAGDDFNARNLWDKPDLDDLRLVGSLSLPLADKVDEALNRELRLLSSFSPRASRQRAHMAWVLKGQFERLGHYDDEARDAFQKAFRRSMEEVGLLALGERGE